MRQLLKDAKGQKEFEKTYQAFNERFWLPLSDKLNKIFDTFSLPPEHSLSLLAFLYHHKFLIPILLEVPQRIREIFGSKVKLSLALEQDPEGGFEELFVVVITVQPPKEAIDLLSELDVRWFLNVLPKTRNRLNITVEVKREQYEL